MGWPMPSSTRSSEAASLLRTHDCRAGSSEHRATVLALEGMPGAGKSTLAATLGRHGHLVVPEYAAVDGSAIRLDDHPAVDQDDAHQRNWLRKHQLAEVLASTNCAGTARCRAGAVWVDRDWLTALAYAYSLNDQALLTARAKWATRHLAAGRLAVASAYLVLRLDPAESLRRRAERLDQAHPWSQPGPLNRLAEFYTDPAGAMGTHARDLGALLADTAWVQVEAPTPRRAVAAAADLLRSQVTDRPSSANDPPIPR